MRQPRLTAIGLVCGLALLLNACKERYRVGEYVLVSWCEGEYPAYVLARKGPARYRVHFDGYDDRWDADVGLEDIKQRLVSAPEPSPPLCEKVARAMGITDEKDSAQSMTYEVGAKVSVTWRGAVYKATIIEVIDRERFRVHYEGHEAAWDEIIDQDRIIKGR
jgi:hypothetical protein